jgi:hypothetical protein
MSALIQEAAKVVTMLKEKGIPEAIQKVMEACGFPEVDEPIVAEVQQWKGTSRLTIVLHCVNHRSI